MQKEAEIAMAAGVIATSLTFAISTFSGVSVQPEVTQKAAESYAALIIKYFPGGIFSLLDRYKEELGAATATILLIKAVSEAREKKAEEESKVKEEKQSKIQGE